MRGLCESYYDLQKVRIAIGNQLYAKDNGLSEQLRTIVKERVLDIVHAAEGGLVGLARVLLRDEPVWTEWLRDVKGIGPVLAANLVSYLNPIERFDTVSKLWRYCGLAAIDGRAERRKRGEKLHYNPRLKTLCWKIGESFVKTGVGYRQLYEQFRKEYDEKWKTGEDCGSEACKKKGECMDGHRYAAAKRKVVKVFLAHYYKVSRELKGLPVASPFIIGIGGHNREIPVVRK